MVRHIHYNLNVDEDFLTVFTSKFITCFIDIHLQAFGFTSGMKSQSIALLLKGKEQIYWILSTQYGNCGITTFKNERVIFLGNQMSLQQLSVKIKNR